MRKKILSLVVVMAMLLSFMPVIAQAATSGECGDNLTWTLDDEGTLTISGTGNMTDWSSYAPWYSSRSSIKNVIIGNSVTSIGSYNTPLTNATIHYNSGSGSSKPPETLTMPSDINNVTINHKGTAYGYFAVTNSSGTALKNKSVSYTIDGGAEQTGKTDAYGYLCGQHIRERR